MDDEHLAEDEVERCRRVRQELVARYGGLDGLFQHWLELDQARLKREAQGRKKTRESQKPRATDKRKRPARSHPEFDCDPSDEQTMQAITLKDAKRNLPRLVEQILADAEARIVVTDKGEQVVMMPLDEFNSWKETLYLLSNPANAEHLRRSISELETGQAQERRLVDE